MTPHDCPLAVLSVLAAFFGHDGGMGALWPVVERGDPVGKQHRTQGVFTGCQSAVGAAQQNLDFLLAFFRDAELHVPFHLVSQASNHWLRRLLWGNRDFYRCGTLYAGVDAFSSINHRFVVFEGGPRRHQDSDRVLVFSQTR